MDAEMIADRRRLRRKLSFWRVLGVLALVGAVLAAGFAVVRRDGRGFGVATQHVARIAVDGVITGSQPMTDLLRRVGQSDEVKAVVISINSPGGTTTGSEELYRNIRELARRKPLVAFVDGTAASGGYITALAADRIVARETSLVGSVGVILQYPQVSGLLDRIGVQVEEVKSSPLKAEPSGVRPTSPEARAALQSVVNDTYDWFKGLVRERRGLSDGELAAVSTGQVFNGRQGVPLKLVDELGGEREAVAWLEREKKVPVDLPVHEWRPRRDSEFSLFSSAAVLAELAGLDGLGLRLRLVGRQAGFAKLDGMLALWHPALGKN